MRETPATLGDVATRRHAARGRALRRCGVVVLALVVAVSISRVLDEEVATSDRSDETELLVRHPRTVRPGNAVDLVVRAVSPGPELTLVTDSAILVDLGIETITPEPATTEGDGSRVRLGFDNPRGRLEIHLSGRVDPGRPAGELPLEIGVAGTAARVDTSVLVLP